MERELVIERLKEEHAALKEKYGRLLNALNDEGFIQEAGEDQVELLLDQESIMRLYLKTLMLRIGNLANRSEAKTEPKKEKEGAKERKKESPSKAPKKDAEEIAVIESFINALKEMLEDSSEKKEGNADEMVSYYVKI